MTKPGGHLDGQPGLFGEFGQDLEPEDAGVVASGGDQEGQGVIPRNRPEVWGCAVDTMLKLRHVMLLLASM